MSHQHLPDTFFGKTPDDSDQFSMLQKITQEYPYCSLGHYFLLKEINLSHVDYKKIAAKTALHFDNPFLLNFLIHKKIPEKKLAPVVSIIPTPPVTLEEPKERTPPAAKEELHLATENTLEKKEEAHPVSSQDELIFEPLHTTDYFASQGIKLSEEAQPTDKLGKQLKSFTDWLKTMKKVHEGKVPLANENMDIAVQRLAEKSNKEADILTESMAEVYQQQGKLKKAAEIYEKLSLLNPAKSGYFAAKIEILKKN